MAEKGTGETAARELGKGWKLSPSVQIKAHTTFTIAEINGSGSIQHIWMTPTGVWRNSIIGFTGTMKKRLRWKRRSEIFLGWDGISMRLFVLLLFVLIPGSAFNCYWPMPFRKKCRITMENIDNNPMTLYYQVDYILTEVPADAAYFHAQFRRVNPLPENQLLYYWMVFRVADSMWVLTWHGVFIIMAGGVKEK